jgi:hypothetical protein
MTRWELIDLQPLVREPSRAQEGRHGVQGQLLVRPNGDSLEHARYVNQRSRPQAAAATGVQRQAFGQAAS